MMLIEKRSRSLTILLLVWLVSRGVSWIFFAPTISPDSMEYLNMGELFASLNFEEVTSSRPFGYGALIAFFGTKPILIVLFQQILSLLIALDIHKILSTTGISGTWRLLIPLAYLLYPLTLFLEFQILSEIVTAFVLMKLTKVVAESSSRRIGKSLAMLMLLVSFIALIRPNTLLLAFGLILFIKQIQIKIKYRSVFLAFSLGIFMAAASNLAVIGTAFPSSNALTSGIAMHMLDAIPGYEANPTLRDLISRAESEVRVASPGSKYWAIQSGAKEYTNAGYDDINYELRKMDLILLKEYPLLFVQSVLGSFFSSFYDNPNGFLPVQRFQFPSFLLLVSFVLAFIFQFGLLGTFIMKSFGDFLARVKLTKSSFATIYISAALLLNLLVNAFVSPVEQNRYMFPMVPVMLILCTALFRIPGVFKSNERH